MKKYHLTIEMIHTTLTIRTMIFSTIQIITLMTSDRSNRRIIENKMIMKKKKGIGSFQETKRLCK